MYMINLNNAFFWFAYAFKSHVFHFQFIVIETIITKIIQY